MAYAYEVRVCGERAENLEQAIEHYELALTFFARETFSEEWVRTQNNLGDVYMNRTTASGRTTCNGRLSTTSWR